MVYMLTHSVQVESLMSTEVFYAVSLSANDDIFIYLLPLCN